MANLHNLIPTFNRICTRTYESNEIMNTFIRRKIALLFKNIASNAFIIHSQRIHKMLQSQILMENKNWRRNTSQVQVYVLFFKDELKLITFLDCKKELS